jgi:predicted nuclease of predicted toxin-antitoxin system
MVDENMPAEVATMSVEAGHDALTVPDQQLGGRPDTEIADICQREGRAIFTLDLDFADIRAYPPSDYPGIVVLRLPRLDKNRVLATVHRLLPTLD